MSFRFTANAIRNQAKTQTRRLGWEFLREGDYLIAVVQTQGLKKGEKVEIIRVIQVTNVRRERLCTITKEDVEAEGYPDMSQKEFIDMFCSKMGIQPWEYVTRIVFTYPDIEKVVS
ncbi:TPA_asm: hypothetical protein vir521_00069 [Caudoviricetes sp. vir521]|nr:TPA_asm: hypothetical protein vir521_00069 [Caudoviricetes sp. vir521]